MPRKAMLVGHSVEIFFKNHLLTPTKAAQEGKKWFSSVAPLSAWSWSLQFKLSKRKLASIDTIRMEEFPF
jgi:hypothetical protein